VIHEEADVVQIPRHVLYEGSDVLLLRAAARSLDSASGPWPDPADSEELRTWLVCCASFRMSVAASFGLSMCLQ
jgi:hypothetical protein